MNAMIAYVDQPAQFVEPDVTGIIFLKRTTRRIQRHMYGKGDRCKTGPIVLIERTIDEDIGIARSKDGRRFSQDSRPALHAE